MSNSGRPAGKDKAAVILGLQRGAGTPGPRRALSILGQFIMENKAKELSKDISGKKPPQQSPQEEVKKIKQHARAKSMFVGNLRDKGSVDILDTILVEVSSSAKVP